MLKKLSAFFVLCHLCFSSTFAQPAGTRYISSADSSQIQRVVNRKLPVFKTPRFQNIVLDTTSQQYRAHYTYVSYTEKGDCAKTNGCTIATTYVFILNQKKRIISKSKSTSLYHNYE